VDPPPPLYNNNGVKKAGPTYISSRHRQYIGEGTHTPTPTNQFGLSRNQRIIVAALQAHDSENPDSWINGSLINHVSRDSNGNSFAGAFTVSSSSPIADDTNVPDNTTPPEPLHSLTESVAPSTPSTSTCPMTPPAMSASSASSSSSASSASSTSSRAQYDFRHDRTRAPIPAHEVEYNLVDLTPPRQHIPVIAPTTDSDDEYDIESDNHIITMVLLDNQLVVHNDDTTLTPHMINYFNVAIDRFHVDDVHGPYQDYNLSRYKVYTTFVENTGHYRVDLALFGWSPSYPLVNYGVNPVFRQGTPALLELITSLGSVFLRADRTAASTDIPLSESSYMTFSPLGSVYHAQQTPGSYVSMTSSLQSYKYYYDLIKDIQSPHKTYLLLAIIYDFMAFTAQLYSRLLGDHRLNLPNMNCIRGALLKSINRIMSAYMIDEYKDLISIFKVIAETSMPLPRVKNSSFMTPVQTRRPREPGSAALQKMDIDDPVLKRPRIETLHNNPFPIIYAEVPQPMQKPSIDLRSPTPTPDHAPDTAGGDSTSDDSEQDSKINFFSTISLNVVTTAATRFVMDSGAGKCGTSDLSLLSNVKPCKDVTVSGAFGPSTTPTHAGTFGPLNLDAVHIKGMGSQTLVSLSQFCAGGTTGQKFIGVFTPTEYRMYDMLSALPVIAELAKHGQEAERGSVQNGIYVREST
jgi:hypothetical protein